MITPEQERYWKEWSDLAHDIAAVENAPVSAEVMYIRAGMLADIFDALSAERQAREKAEQERDNYQASVANMAKAAQDLIADKQKATEEAQHHSRVASDFMFYLDSIREYIHMNDGPEDMGAYGETYGKLWKWHEELKKRAEKAEKALEEITRIVYAGGDASQCFEIARFALYGSEGK